MINIKNNNLFKSCIEDLMDTGSVQSMCNISQHVNVNCLEHCIFVSFISFKLCRLFNLDFAAAARGGLLHDLFLYNQKNRRGHLTSHPKSALVNASSICDLNDIEKDIILKHMWPVTSEIPKYKESFIVNCADKLCALSEMLFIYHLMNLGNKLKW